MSSRIRAANFRPRTIIPILLVLVASSILPLMAYAQAPIAKVNSFVGEVFVRSAVTAPRGEWRRITAVPVNLVSGDEVRTERGRAEIIYPNDDAVRILENSSTRLTTTEETRRVLFFRRTVKLRTVATSAAKLWFNVTVDRDNEMEFRSPVAVASIRGSQGEFNVDPQTVATFIGFATGGAAFRALGTTVNVGANQGSVVAGRGRGPSAAFSYTPGPPPAISSAAMEAALAAPTPAIPSVPAEAAVAPPAPAAGAPSPPAVPSGGGGGGAASPSR